MSKRPESIEAAYDAVNSFYFELHRHPEFFSMPLEEFNPDVLDLVHKYRGMRIFRHIPTGDVVVLEYDDSSWSEMSYALYRIAPKEVAITVWSRIE